MNNYFAELMSESGPKNPSEGKVWTEQEIIDLGVKEDEEREAQATKKAAEDAKAALRRATWDRLSPEERKQKSMEAADRLSEGEHELSLDVKEQIIYDIMEGRLTGAEAQELYPELLSGEIENDGDEEQEEEEGR